MDLEQFPTSETAKELLESVTKGWYDQSYVGKWLYQVMGISLDQVKERYLDLSKQFFVESATWGLAYHEQKYGLPIRQELSPEERRFLIIQRMKKKGAMSPYNIEQLIERQLGLHAQVSDIHDPGSFSFYPDHPNIFHVVIWEDNKNSMLNYPAVESLICQVKQSHTQFSVEHRQIFKKTITAYIEASISKQTTYEIQPKPLEKNKNKKAEIYAAGIVNQIIVEEIHPKEIEKNVEIVTHIGINTVIEQATMEEIIAGRRMYGGK